MPVQYQPYKSMYVSQRSPEISQMLRERYVQNFSMQDTVKQKLLELETAPFEGDRRAKEQLANEIRSKLDGMAERGDYENLTMEIANTARQYQDKATPLAKNAELYKADKAEKDQLLQSGKIKLSDYNGWLKKASMKFDTERGDYTSYQGVEFNEDGSIKQGTMYDSTPIAQFVDVQKEILTQLNALDKVKEGGYTVQGYQTMNGTEYAITKGGQIVEYISPERVNQITQGVLSRPDVQSYLNQEAEFSVIDADDNTLNDVLATNAAKLRSQGNTNEALQIEAAINSGNTGQKRQLAQQLKLNDRLNQYTNMGISSKATRSAYGGSFAMEYSAKAVQAMKDKGETVVNTPVFYGDAEKITSALAGENGVVTSESIRENVKKAQDSAVTAIEILKANVPEYESLDSTELQNIINAESYESLAKLAAETSSPGSTYKQLAGAKQAIEAASAIETSANRASQLAYTNSEYTPENVSNYAIAEVATSMGVEASNISNEFLKLLQPGVQGYTEDVSDAYLGVAERITSEIKSNNLTPGGNTVAATANALAKLTGLSVEEAEEYAMTAASNVKRAGSNSTAAAGSPPFFPANIDSYTTPEYRGFTPIDSGLDAFVSEFMDSYVDIARERSREYYTQLKENTSGEISFGETDYAIGADKKKSEDFIKSMKNRTLSDFSQARGLGQASSLAGMFADQVGLDPEDVQEVQSLMDSYSVDKVAFTKGAFPNGQVESVLEITAKGPEDSQMKFKVRYDDIVASYPGFDSEIMGYHGTSADIVTNNIYTQILSAPGAALRYGVDYEYNDPIKGNLSFKFIPSLGANNSITGFREIGINGNVGGNPLNVKLDSLEDFYIYYNDFISK